MEFNSTNDIEIKETIFNKKEIIVGLILKFLTSVSSTFGTIYQISINWNRLGMVDLTYFTIISNIVINIMCYIFLVLDLYRIIMHKDPRKNWLYTLKFTATVGIMVTFIIYIGAIFPSNVARQGFMTALFSQPSNICLHIITPILAVIDFFYSDYNFKSKRWYVYFPVIYLFSYFVIVVLLSVCLNVIWPIGEDMVLHMPYTFADYTRNGWFTFDLSKFNLKSGTTGIGLVYVVIIMSIFVILLSLLFLKIKNKIQRKKYNITLKENTYHADK